MTEEVLPQYEFAEIFQKTATLYRASPAPFGGTLPKGEGFDCAVRNCISPIRRADHSDQSRRPNGLPVTCAAENALSAGTAR